MTTPSQAIAQGIFDIVVERGSHLSRRCVDPLSGACAYRDGQGGACYVGLLLSDEEAKDGNGRTVSGSVQSLYMDEVLPERLIPHLTLLSRLQKIHDNKTNWADEGQGAPNRRRIAQELRDVAFDHQLKTDAVDEHYAA